MFTMLFFLIILVPTVLGLSAWVGISRAKQHDRPPPIEGGAETR